MYEIYRIRLELSSQPVLLPVGRWADLHHSAEDVLEVAWVMEAGKHVKLEGLTSKKGTTYSCTVRFGKKRSDGRMGIIPEFDKENFPE